MRQYNLDRIFQPRRVAVVGTSESTGSIVNALMGKLLRRASILPSYTYRLCRQS
jgi:acyl-CoA synthetase (NDP forming)